MSQVSKTVDLFDGTMVSITAPAEIVRAFDRARGRVVPMKPDPEIDAAQARTIEVAGDELRQFVERIEQIEAEQRDLAQVKKDAFAEAKGRGYDARALRQIIALRRRKPDDVAEEEAVLGAYKLALGMD